MHIRSARLAAAACLSIALPAGAADIAIDPSFASDGFYRDGEPSGTVRTLAHLARGPASSIAVLARTSSVPEQCPAQRTCVSLVLFDDGYPPFRVDVPSSINFSTLAAAAYDGENRIVLVGSIAIGSGADVDMRVARVWYDGDPDTHFDEDGIRDLAFDVGGDKKDAASAVVTEGARIVVVGTAQFGPGDYDFAVARLGAFGQYDTDFGGGGKTTFQFDLTGAAYDAATSVAMAPGGKILVAGIAHDRLLEINRSAVARLNGNGDLDTTFCASGCVGNPYPATKDGRRAGYFGTELPARDTSLDALAVKDDGGFAIAGIVGPRSGDGAYVQRFDAAGNLLGARAIDGGGLGAPQIRGLHYTWPQADDSFLLVTGASNNGEYFFAQNLLGNLEPIADWGNVGEARSVFRWSGGGEPDGDVGHNVPAQSSIDESGRIHVGGSYKTGNLAQPDLAVIARLVRPREPGVFSDDFEGFPIPGR